MKLNVKILKYQRFIIKIGLLLFLLSNSANGQVKNKKFLTAADYGLWGKLEPKLLSDNGNWVSFSVHYESNQDTLFVRNAHTFKTHVFPNGYNGKFSKEDFFACFSSPNVLEIINLKTDQITKFNNVIDYLFTADHQYLILTLNDKKQKNMLICKPDCTIVKHLENIGSYSLNSDESILCFSTKDTEKTSVELLFLDNNFKRLNIVNRQSENFEKITWSKNGKVLGFYGISENKFPHLYYYNLEKGQLVNFESDNLVGFPREMLLSSDLASMSLSDDGKRVFVSICKNISPPIISSDTPMVWNTNDDLLFTEKKQMESRNYYGVWSPINNSFLQITNDTLSGMILNGKQNVAILSETGIYETQFKDYKDGDYWLLDLFTGHKKIILKKHSVYGGSIIASPQGGYFSYFKNNNWWTYNISQNTHTNITQNIDAKFSEMHYVKGENKEPFGIAGWGLNDESLLVYDDFDVWQITPDGSFANPLTNGKEKKLVYRIATQDAKQSKSSNYSGFTSGSFNLKENFYLRANSLDYTVSGYYSFHHRKGIQPIISKIKQIDYLTVSKTGKTCMYLEQSFNQSPILSVKSDLLAPAKQIYQANNQQRNYFWGSAQSISYTNNIKKPLKGILFYPADYDPKKQYSMVVYIYEKLSHKLHLYVNPSLNNSTGFNVSNLTTQGYFVLYPDIVYQEGQVGESALDCVLAAIDQALLTASISPTDIGIIGHSFGGYQTNYIISHTNIFAAAVAGAAVTDLTSFYLQLNGTTGKSNYWRFEFQQFRMGKSFFEDKVGYLNNSPVLNAENVNTPLLSWAGDADPQVHYFQSVEFFLALKRLKKKHTMILYPNEEHALQERKNQQHLTEYIEKWFFSYLKKDNGINCKSSLN